MALATQCPHCHTAFKVAYDQLKLRAGLVRCGTCKQVFNGIENLVRPDGLTSGLSAGIPAAPPAPAPESLKPTTTDKSVDLPPLDLTALEEPPPPVSFAPSPTPLAAPTPTPAPIPDIPASTQPVASIKAADPLHYTSLADFTLPQNSEPAPPPAAAPETPPVLPVIDKPLAEPVTLPPPQPEPEPEPAPKSEPELPPAPKPEPAAAPAQKQAPVTTIPLPEEETLPETEAADFSLAEDETETHEEEAEADASEAEQDEIAEPDFVLRSRRRQRIGRALRLVMGIGSVILLIGAVLQGAYAFRNQLAAWFPQTKPVLAQLCQVAGCQVRLPAQIDMVTIESNELQALAADKNTFLLTLLLRNHSAVAQAWPSIELTLNDADETALARRVLQPRDYLPPTQDVTRGFAANSEQPLKLSFELAQLKASGYRVYLFYP